VKTSAEPFYEPLSARDALVNGARGIKIPLAGNPLSQRRLADAMNQVAAERSSAAPATSASNLPLRITA